MSDRSGVESIAPEPQQNETTESVVDKKKWLENAFSNGKEEKKEHDTAHQSSVSNELTSDKVKWLREQAFNKTSEQNEGGEVVPISNELTKDRVRRLEEQAFKKNQKSTDEIEDDEETASVSNELTTDRVRWLQDKAFQKNQTKRDGDEEEEEAAPVSNELTTDRVRWLQDKAFQKNQTGEEGEEAAPVSNELTSDKVRWLQEQAFQKNQTGEDGEEAAPVPNELTTDKVRWLQEQAFQNHKTGEDGEEAATVSNELTTDRVQLLEEQDFQNKKENEVLSWGKAAPDERSNNGDNDSYIEESDAESDYGSAHEDEESAVEAQEIPDGNDNDDLYALLAYSKGRIKDRKIEDDAQDSKVRKEEEEDEANHAPTPDGFDLDDDLSEDDDASYDSLNGREDDSKDGNDGDDNDNERSNEIDAKLSIDTRESQVKQSKTETDELWALLNYSKVRLATGATPTADEAKALGIREDNVVLVEDSDDEADSDYDDEENASDSDSDLNDSFMTDDSAISNGEATMDETEIKRQDDLAATRARALAALERTKQVYGDVDDADEISQQMDHAYLSEKQLLKSIVLAEEASQSGVKDFKTQEKLAVLDSVPTPTKRRKGKTRFGRGRGGSMKRDIGGEISSFSQRALVFLSETKKKAGQALDNMKETVEKIEKHNTRGKYYDSSSPGIEVRKKDSPFKNFSNNILKVEKMNDEKYGDDILYV